MVSQRQGEGEAGGGVARCAIDAMRTVRAAHARPSRACPAPVPTVARVHFRPRNAADNPTCNLHLEVVRHLRY